MKAIAYALFVLEVNIKVNTCRNEDTSAKQPVLTVDEIGSIYEADDRAGKCKLSGGACQQAALEAERKEKRRTIDEVVQAYPRYDESDSEELNDEGGSRTLQELVYRHRLVAVACTVAADVNGFPPSKPPRRALKPASGLSVRAC